MATSLIDIFKEDIPVCLIFCGAPGTGKSTAANYLLQHNERFVRISSDKIIESLAEEKNLTYNETFSLILRDKMMKDIENSMWKEFDQALADKRSLIIDRTNMTVKSRSKWIEKVKDNGYRIIAVAFDSLTPAENHAFNSSRPPGRKINEKIIDDMRSRYEDPSETLIEEGYDMVVSHATPEMFYVI